MRVIVGFHYAAGDHFVAEDESQIIIVQHIEVLGYWIPVECAQLCNDGPFLTLTLSKSDEDSPYLNRANKELDKLRKSLTADEWLEGTTDQELVLPVSSVEFKQLVLA